MRKRISFVSIILAGLIMTGCSNSKKNEFEGIPAQELYDKGQIYLQDEDYANAIRYLEAIDLYSNDGMYSESTQLSIIYAKYKMGEYYEALDNAERFARSYPNSANMDYVHYLAGLSNIRLGDNWIQDLFGVNRSSRAVENIRNAYGNFQIIVQQYPKGQYTKDAENWMAYLLNRLAEHDLKIAEFYMKRKAYVAVANRVEQMTRFYPDSKPTADALPMLQKSFEAMGIDDSAQKVAALIEANKTKSYPHISKPEYSEQF